MKSEIPSEADCKRAASRLDDLLPEIFDYARRKRLIDKPFAQYEMMGNVWENYPEGWEDNVLGMLAGFSVCGKSKQCAGFVRSTRDRLPESLLSLSRAWRGLPWIWCAFSVSYEVSDSIVAISPIGTRPSSWPQDTDWSEMILYSPVVSDHFRHGTDVFLAQLLVLDRVFHTYGAILPFTTIDETDLLAFADYAICATYTREEDIPSLAGVPNRVDALSDTIAEDPLSFLRLTEYMQVPTVTGKQGVWRRNASVTPLPDLPELREPERWEALISNSRHNVRSLVFQNDAGALYLDGDSPAYEPTVYVDFIRRLVFLYALNDMAYESGRDALKAVSIMPEQPISRCSLTIVAAARSIFGVSDRLDILMEQFEDVEEPHSGEGEHGLDGDDLPTFDELQMVLDRLMHNYNEGIEEPIETTAEVLGVAKKTVESIVADFSETLQRRGDDAELDRMGLSPRAFTELVSCAVPFVAGAISLRSIDTLEQESRVSSMASQTQLVRFSQWLLGTVAVDNKIPATQAGYVKPSIIPEAMQIGVIKDPVKHVQDLFPHLSMEEISEKEDLLGLFRFRREGDAIEFHRLRQVLEKARLIRLKGGSFVVSDTAQQLINDPLALYMFLMQTMFERFNWDEAYRLPAMPGLRERASFLLYALHRLSFTEEGYKWIPLERLVDAYVGSVAGLRSEIASDTDSEAYFDLGVLASSVIRHAFVEFLGGSLGLVEMKASVDRNVTDQDDHLSIFADIEHSVRPTELFSLLFSVTT